VSSTIEIKLTGKGGQGVVSAGEILANAAVLDGKEASAVAAYGSEARGGAVSSDVVIGDAEIPAPFVITPTYVLAMSMEGYAAVSKLLAADTKVVYDSTTIRDAPRDANHFPVPATEIASSVGNPVVINMVLLGAASLFLPLEASALEAAIAQLFGRKGEAVVSKNVEAFRAGRNVIQSA